MGEYEGPFAMGVCGKQYKDLDDKNGIAAILKGPVQVISVNLNLLMRGEDEHGRTTTSYAEKWGITDLKGEGFGRTCVRRRWPECSG